MTLPQREHPEAVTEFDAAVRWYEEQEPAHERREPGYWIHRLND